LRRHLVIEADTIVGVAEFCTQGLDRDGS
jgi:hypothetical protein